MGARERTSSSAPLVPGRQSVGSDRGASSAQHNPFLALRRPTTDRGARRGIRLQPRLLGQLPRRGRGRPVRDDPRPDRHRARHLRLAPRARARRSRRPEAIVAYSDDGLGGAVATRSTACTASGWPAGRGATGRGRSSSTTGRRPTSTSTQTELRRDRRRRRATSASSCSSSTTAGSASATTTRQLARRLGRRPAQAARRPRRRRRDGSRRSGMRLRPVDRARDGQRATATCSARTRTGRSASPAGRGPRAASSSSSTWRRPEVVDHLFERPDRRSSRARRSRTSSGT